MTIAEITEKLAKEREFGSRFPVRVIFVNGLKRYAELISHLRSACDETINIADFGKEDVVPQFDKIREYVKNRDGKQILLLSVGEYIRLCFKREINKERAQFRSLWELMQPESSKTRIVIPLFCCNDYFDRIIGKPNERQEEYVWRVDEDKRGDSYELSVYSPQFDGVIGSNADNLEDWLRNWTEILKSTTHPIIITKQYKNTEECYGNITIKLIVNPFTYVQNFVKDLDTDKESLETAEFWAKVASMAGGRSTFATIVMEQINTVKFSFCDVIAKWQMLNEFQRELVWLWYKIYPTDDYYSFACNKAKTANEIPERIRDEILSLSSRTFKWIDERKQAMSAIKFSTFSEEYFNRLDQLPLPETRLQMLTYRTHEERAYAIKTISQMLRNGTDIGYLSEIVGKDFPALSVYLNATIENDNNINTYFAWYRRSKIINRFSLQPIHNISYDTIDSRLKVLQQIRNDGSYEFWIDGFGVEWLPVLLYELRNRNIHPESKFITTAKLPTETEYNHQWDTEDPLCKKWDKLDKLSHHGMPDDKSYFSCIAYQLEVFANAAREIDELLNKYEYVIVTGDHGSSRLAALGFHSDRLVSTQLPKGAVAHNFGRFCEFKSNSQDYIPQDFMTMISERGKDFVVMNDYNMFVVGGNAAGGNTDEQDVVGEIHGGNTPEERLVPVILLHRSKPIPSLKCTPRATREYVKNGHVETILKFNRSVKSLEVKVGDVSGVCVLESDGWHVSFENIGSDQLALSIVADGNVLSDTVVIDLKKRGISSNSGGLL